MAAAHNTVDGQAPVDGDIESALEPGMLDPTNEEAIRALAIMNGEVHEDGSIVKAADGKDDAAKTAPEYFDDADRNSIAKNWRDSKRGKKEGEDAEPLDIAGAENGPNSLAMQYGTQIAAENQSTDPGETVDEASLTPAAVQKPTVKVKVDGQMRDVTQDELIANYQIGEAARLRLQQATEILNSAKTVRDGAPIKADGDGPSRETDASTSEPDKSSTPKGAKFDRVKLASAVEKMQLGTTEEGVEALGELLDSVAPQQESLDISSHVETVIAQREISRTSEDATTAFAKKYPDLVKDSILRQVTGELVALEMVKDFEAAGLSKEVIAEKMPNRAAIKAYHDFARMKNPEFGRSLAQLYETAEKAPHFVKLTGGKLPEVKVNLSREERKMVVQQQPALRTATPPANARTTPLTRNERMSQAVRQTQLERGQNAST